MEAPDRIAAWRPRLHGVAEVFHAAWHDHAYPPHTHDTWTVLIVDDGLIGFGLDRNEHSAVRTGVTLLPPHVPHDGKTVTAAGFRKRVLYLDEDVLSESLTGPAVDHPFIDDLALREQVSRLDRALIDREDLEAETRMALLVERLSWHLKGHPSAQRQPAPPALARQTREMIDSNPTAPLTLTEIADRLGVTTAHLVRSFTRSYGMPPHRYVLGRRLDLARRRLLADQPISEVAVQSGFYDQAHLTRHFQRLLRTTPGRYQRSQPTRSS